MSKVSVIVPVYKVEPYLKRCVDSILEQTFQDFDLILVDDGSPDRCGDICEEYAKKDGRVVVIRQPNGGLSAARNAGIEWVLKNSNSEWLTFIDSDDWVSECYLQQLISCAEDFKAKVVVAGIQAVNEDGSLAWAQIPANAGVVDPEDLMVEYKSLGTWACGKLFQVDSMQNVRFPVGKVYEDRHTTHKIVFSGGVVSTLGLPLYFYRHARPGNISGRDKTMKNVQDRVSGLCCQIDFFHQKGFCRAEQAVAIDLMGWMRQAVGVFTKGPESSLVRELFGKLREKYWDSCWRTSDMRCKYRCSMYPRAGVLWIMVGAISSILDGGWRRLLRSFLYRVHLKK